MRVERYPITRAGITSNRKRHWPVNARWHDLRHTAIRRTIRANGNLKLGQTLAGHSDPATTAKFYADVLVDGATAADLEFRKSSRSDVSAVANLESIMQR